MSAQESAVSAEVSSSRYNPAMQREVVRRASQLCLRAEPHTDESPCPTHLTEASRQLLGLSG